MNNKNKLSQMLEPTPEQKERMLANIMNARNSAAKKGDVHMKRIKKPLAAIIAVCCAITVTVVAVSFGLDWKFLDFLKVSSDEQAEYLANGAFVVSKSVTNENGTLTVNQVIGDANLTYVLMDFTAPEGTILNHERYGFEYIDLYIGQDMHALGLDFVEDENVDDNKISMIMSVMTKKTLAGCASTLLLTNLQIQSGENGNSSTLQAGEWKISFPLNFKEYSAEHEVNIEITLFGHSAKIKTLAISPISVTIKLESEFLKEISNGAKGKSVSSVDVNINEFPIEINFEDGTSEMTTVLNGMNQIDYINRELLSIKVFDGIINDKAIKSVAFFDTEIPVR